MNYAISEKIKNLYSKKDLDIKRILDSQTCCDLSDIEMKIVTCFMNMMTVIILIIFIIGNISFTFCNILITCEQYFLGKSHSRSHPKVHEFKVFITDCKN